MELFISVMRNAIVWFLRGKRRLWFAVILSLVVSAAVSWYIVPGRLFVYENNTRLPFAVVVGVCAAQGWLGALLSALLLYVYLFVYLLFRAEFPSMLMDAGWWQFCLGLTLGELISSSLWILIAAVLGICIGVFVRKRWALRVCLV